MAFRISDSMIFQNAIQQAQLNRSELSRLQAQVSAGKRLLSVGDDPTAASQVLGVRRALGRIDQFNRNIDTARSSLEPVESTLLSLTDVLTRLRELAVSADIEEGEFDKIQPEVEQLFDQVLALANTSVSGRHLFAGFASDNPAFTKIGDFVAGVVDISVPPEPYARYDGDNGVLQIQISEGTTIDASVTGREVFFGSTDGDDIPDGSNVDIFDVIRDFRNRLQDPAGQGPPADVVGDLDAALDQVLHVLGRSGALSTRLDIAEAQLVSLELTLLAEHSSLEGSSPEAQIAAASELLQREQTFQTSLAVTARIIQPNLLNFLS